MPVFIRQQVGTQNTVHIIQFLDDLPQLYTIHSLLGVVTQRV